MVFKGQKVESRHHFIADCFAAVLLVSAVFLVRIRLSEIFRIHLVSDELHIFTGQSSTTHSHLNR